MLLIINNIQIIACKKIKIHDVTWKKNKEIWNFASCNISGLDDMIKETIRMRKRKTVI